MNAIEILEELKIQIKQAVHKLESRYEMKEVDYLDFDGSCNNLICEIENNIKILEGKEPSYDNSELETQFRKDVL